MPTKLVIVLDEVQPRHWRYALWADVPAARQTFYAQPGLASAWRGASVAENTALATGAVTERTGTIEVAVGSTLSQIQAQILAIQAAFQLEITTLNSWSRYGSYYDGASWTAGGVA